MNFKELQKRVLDNKINQFGQPDLYKEYCLSYSEMAESFQAMMTDDPTLGEELADVIIYLMGIAELKGIDLGYEVDRKININERRVYEKQGDGFVKVKPEALAIDFDGPICDLFRGYDTDSIERHLEDSSVCTSYHFGINAYNIFPFLESQTQKSTVHHILKEAESVAALSCYVYQESINAIKFFANHIPVCVVTNNDQEVVSSVLRSNGINIGEGGIEVFGRTSECIVKPDPILLEGWIKKHNLAPNKIIIVGNAPTDKLFASKLGSRFVALREECPLTPRIQSLNELRADFNL